MPSDNDARPRRAWQTGRTPLLGCVALLVTAGFLSGCGLIFGPDRPGWRGAVAFAAAVSLPGALTAWILTHLPQRTAALAVATPLAAVALRIMPPLAALAWLASRPNATDAAPILVVFYLALLAVDISLHIMVARDRGNTGDWTLPD